MQTAQTHTFDIGPYMFNIDLIFANPRSALHSPTQNKIMKHFSERLFIWTKLRPYIQRILQRCYYITPFVTENEDYRNNINGAWKYRYQLFIVDHDDVQCAVQTDENWNVEISRLLVEDQSSQIQDGNNMPQCSSQPCSGQPSHRQPSPGIPGPSELRPSPSGSNPPGPSPNDSSQFLDEYQSGHIEGGTNVPKYSSHPCPRQPSHRQLSPSIPGPSEPRPSPSDSNPLGPSPNDSSQPTTEESFSGFDSQTCYQIEAQLLAEKVNFSDRATDSQKALVLQLQGMRKTSDNEIKISDTSSNIRSESDIIHCFDSIGEYYRDVDIVSEWTNGENNSPCTYSMSEPHAQADMQHNYSLINEQYKSNSQDISDPVQEFHEDIPVQDLPEDVAVPDTTAQDLTDNGDSQVTICEVVSPPYYTARSPQSPTSASSKSENFTTPPNSLDLFDPAILSQDTAMQYQQLFQPLDLPASIEDGPGPALLSEGNSQTNANMDISLEGSDLVIVVSPDEKSSPIKFVNSPKIVPQKRRPLQRNCNVAKHIKTNE